MVSTTATVVTGLVGFDALHARELPQKDNLCGAFWAALVLRASGVEEVDGEPVDQDFVALHAGTLLPEGDPAAFLPRGGRSRSDYRLPIPLAGDPAESGTSAPALARTIGELSHGGLGVVPVAGPWDAARALLLVETAAALSPAATLIANLRTGHLWGSRAAPASLLGHLAGRPVEPEPPDWDVGHFVTLAGTVRGPGGSLVLVRDTYPMLGWGGYYLQPPAALGAALARGDGREGGVLCVLPAGDESVLRARLEENGYALRHWNNGTPDPGGED